ncbi:MAG TPA: DUF6311 domain-containing protein [Noviherbaspirillum sp.]|uniref:DUF6311 domain-containing protein n=1 Tax=Noviherbaspirillum sp. TaxID=1926288 RepID=UPI002DDCF7E0|nr:DUF6311 domain-containing protein [Noviherbaspirillum sp.]HEV2610854.1 DUF6311 domain-containing protein [Noviherbaspirillum sp.]
MATQNYSMSQDAEFLSVQSVKRHLLGKVKDCTGLATKEIFPLTSYLFASLLGIAFVLSIYPLAFLLGVSGFFETADPANHVSGWLFYAEDEWRFPLLQTERLNHPEGVNIAFMDSIPLPAILFKFFSHYLPAGFHYFGLWHGVIFVSQALASNFLIRTLGHRHLVATISAVTFGLLWPALLWRFNHTALMTHSVILFSLGLYFLGFQKKGTSNTVSGALILVCVIALTVHPYLLAFCYPFFVAFLGDRAAMGESRLKLLFHLLTSVAVILGVLLAFGYTGHGKTTAPGFDYYSMNLLAPLCGGTLFPCTVDGSGGQYEGYNYFGLGLLFLLPFAIFKGRASIIANIKKHPTLSAILLLFTLYALSTTIYVGKSIVFSYSLPSLFDWVIGTFRGSGRFFWVAGYFILFATLSILLKEVTSYRVCLLAIALVVQWVDTQHLRKMIAHAASKPATNEIDHWKPLIADVKKINFFPEYGCGSSDWQSYLIAQRVAGYNSLLFNTAYTTRPNQTCERRNRTFDMPFQKDELYVTLSSYVKTHAFNVPIEFEIAARKGECIEWQQFILCTPGRQGTYWNSVLPHTRPIHSLHKNKITIPADSLPTQIGQLQESQLVASSMSQVGYLSYGPYLFLERGKYRFTLRYASSMDLTAVVGNWDVVLKDSANMLRTIDAGALYGTLSGQGTVDGNFSVEDRGQILEVRTFFLGKSDLRIKDLSIEKL